MLSPRSYTPPPRTQTLPRSRAARELYFSANSDILIVNRREVSFLCLPFHPVTVCCTPQPSPSEAFPASSPSLSPLQGLQPWQFPQNTGSKEEPLLTTPLYGELHLHTFRCICWRSSERRMQSQVVVDRPRLCRAVSVDANVDGLKNSNTHQRIAKAIFFSFDAPSSRTLKLKKASLHYFRRPCHQMKVAVPWFSSAFWFSIVVSWNLQAEASVTGRGRAAAWSISKEVFFFWYFRKKLRAQTTRNKENNNSGLNKEK